VRADDQAVGQDDSSTVVLPAVMCLECRCVYRPARTPLKVVQEGGSPRCGYVGWTLALPGTVIDGGAAATEPAHALLQRVAELRGLLCRSPR